MKIKILPSLLAADFGYLADESKKAEISGADELHLDIMDGHLVPNLSMGPDVVKMASRAVDIPLNVHLMISNVDQHIQHYIDAGADTILIHIEADCNVPEELKRIKDAGVRSGITLNPDTPAELIYPVLPDVDEVLCMSVHPGFGGQSFIEYVLPKLRLIRDEANRIGKTYMDLMVDGGINFETTRKCAEHGCNKFVAGTFLYGAEDMAAGIAQMREIAEQSLAL